MNISANIQPIMDIEKFNPGEIMRLSAKKYFCRENIIFIIVFSDVDIQVEFVDESSCSDLFGINRKITCSKSFC
jgi:hypothetical protein